MFQLQLLHHDENHAIGIVGNVTLQVWRGKEPLLNFAQEMMPVNQWMEKKYNKGYLGLMLIESTCGLPSQERMKEAAHVWHAFDHALKAFALVVDGEGIRAATLRGAATTVNLLASPKSPMKIYSQSPPALAWLETFGGTLDDNVPQAQLAQALQTARKHELGQKLTRLAVAV